MCFPLLYQCTLIPKSGGCRSAPDVYPNLPDYIGRAKERLMYPFSTTGARCLLLSGVQISARFLSYANTRSNIARGELYDYNKQTPHTILHDVLLSDMELPTTN